MYLCTQGADCSMYERVSTCESKRSASTLCRRIQSFRILWDIFSNAATPEFEEHLHLCLYIDDVLVLKLEIVICCQPPDVCFFEALDFELLKWHLIFVSYANC